MSATEAKLLELLVEDRAGTETLAELRRLAGADPRPDRDVADYRDDPVRWAAGARQGGRGDPGR